jgi:signal transduction histidine kinase
LTNVRLHANARRVDVSLDSDDAEGRLTIEDDGAGLPERAAEGRYGIVGMRERAADIGGSFAIGLKPGGGTCVSARVPLAP